MAKSTQDTWAEDIAQLRQRIMRRIEASGSDEDAGTIALSIIYLADVITAAAIDHQGGLNL